MSTDKFYVTPLRQLIEIIFKQLDVSGEVFNIPRELFYFNKGNESYVSERFGQVLETPIGVAAGPHTQLSQNIVGAWLTGSRFIELKTIQTLDELEIAKPCIDMQDEGYNCEWSQELKIEQSFSQYLDAWILIHILKDKLGVGRKDQPGFIFNMSVGYDLEGILKPNVQWFFDKMADASQELQQKIDSIKDIYPKVVDLNISPNLSDNVTLSTMHGCPPGEVEKIALYLLREKKLHTAVKFNPTLLGKNELHEILGKSGFDTKVPDQAFEHDLKYNDALKIISNLRKAATENNLQFSLKLTNTLESINHKEVFPSEVDMMYNSGRSVHPVSVALANKLQQEYNGELDISFSGGAHAFNIAKLVSCGLAPVTVCTDLLKPGGYGRQRQYIEEINSAFLQAGAKSVEEFITKTAGKNEKSFSESILQNLKKYSEETIQSGFYKKEDLHDPSIKTDRPLGFFDCIYAPCEDTCSTNQDIPGYNYHASKGNFEEASKVVLQTNPFPRTTGMICDHLCQTKCTRINYDKPVLIREIKRFIAERAAQEFPGQIPSEVKSKASKKVAIIGAGPSGFSAAYFLAMAGFTVEIFEGKNKHGGMVSGVIPAFRLTDEAIDDDVKRIKRLGVKVHFGVEVNKQKFEDLKSKFDYVYIAAGAQKSARLKIEGIDSKGVIDPLELLEKVRSGTYPNIGNTVAVIGGGNTAMDVARTAYRLVGKSGKVIVIYRRTVKQMPADIGEIKAVMEEGIDVMELTAPVKINTEKGAVKSVTCKKMKLGDKDESGRRRPVEISGSEFEVKVDTVIPAIGQDIVFDFGDGNSLKAKDDSYETNLTNVFIGGDAMRGAATAIKAIGDGRKTAQIIIDREGIRFNTKPENKRTELSKTEHLLTRAKRVFPVEKKEKPINNRKNFDLIASSITEKEAVEEAKRCLLCDEICNICTTVCPNFANYSYKVKPVAYKLKKAVKPPEGDPDLIDDVDFEVKQQYQILNIVNFCNECGNCNTFCPSAGAPYKEKPKVHLTVESFNDAQEGYYFANLPDIKNLIYKNNGSISTLGDTGSEYVYDNDNVFARFNKENFEIKEIKFLNPALDKADFREAAFMSVVMKGVEGLVFG